VDGKIEGVTTHSEAGEKEGGLFQEGRHENPSSKAPITPCINVSASSPKKKQDG